jgi:hypothetical protein
MTLRASARRRHDEEAAPMPRESTTTSAPLDGALVRLSIRGERWAEGLPPAPRGSSVTVSFSSADAAEVHGEALELIGYHVVGVHPAPGSAPYADVLVPEALIASRPRWWRALNAQAERSFGLAFGPAALALADVLRLHLVEPPGR